ncbi:hypothetical protein DM52_418 [Burkholderia mallei]|nr:hypothetical protein DM52_418 [Burkholderia mallei]
MSGTKVDAKQKGGRPPFFGSSQKTVETWRTIA